MVPDVRDGGFLAYLDDCCWVHGDFKGIKINNKIIPMSSAGLNYTWPWGGDAYFYDTDREVVIVIARKTIKFNKGWKL